MLTSGADKDHFALRLYLLSISAADRVPGGVPEWPLISVLQGNAAPESLINHSASSPQRRALALQRRRPRPVRHSLEACFQGLRSALHPQAQLVWLVLCLEGHGIQAVPGLLRIIATPLPSPTRYAALAEACCWALGQLGRDVLPEIEVRFRGAPPALKDRYCEALWYLGTDARGCERWIGEYDSPWARAVLYRLDRYGTVALIHRRAAPI